MYLFAGWKQRRWSICSLLFYCYELLVWYLYKVEYMLCKYINVTSDLVIIGMYRMGNTAKDNAVNLILLSQQSMSSLSLQLFQCYIQQVVEICQKPTSIMDLIIKFANEDNKWWVKSFIEIKLLFNVNGLCERKYVQYTPFVNWQYIHCNAIFITVPAKIIKKIYIYFSQKNNLCAAFISQIIPIYLQVFALMIRMNN